MPPDMCAECGDAVSGVAKYPNELPPADDNPEAGPVLGGSGRVYCDQACAAEAQGGMA